MTVEADGYFNQPRGIAWLWAGVLAGPIAWFLHQQVSYVLAALSCSDALTFVLHMATVVAILIAIAGAGIAWINWRRTGRAWSTQVGGTLARSRFMALSGLLLSFLFLLVIVAQGIPNFFFSPC